jgi:hypothetical protein
MGTTGGFYLNRHCLCAWAQVAHALTGAILFFAEMVGREGTENKIKFNAISNNCR